MNPLRASTNRIRVRLSGAVLAAGLLLAPVAHADTSGLRPDGSIVALVDIEDAGFEQRIAAAVRPDGSLDRRTATRRAAPAGARRAPGGAAGGQARMLRGETDCSRPFEAYTSFVFLDRYDAAGARVGQDLFAAGDSAYGIDVTPAGAGILALASEDEVSVVRRFDAANAPAGPSARLDSLSWTPTRGAGARRGRARPGPRRGAPAR